MATWAMGKEKGDFMKKLKWQKPTLVDIGSIDLTDGCEWLCSKGYQATQSCYQGAGINGHRED